MASREVLHRHAADAEFSGDGIPQQGHRLGVGGFKAFDALAAGQRPPRGGSDVQPAFREAHAQTAGVVNDDIATARPQRVHALAARQHIAFAVVRRVLRAAPQRVVTVAAEECVGARPTAEHIVVCPAFETIGAFRTEQLVRAAGAVEAIVLRRAAQEAPVIGHVAPEHHARAQCGGECAARCRRPAHEVEPMREIGPVQRRRAARKRRHVVESAPVHFPEKQGGAILPLE